MGRWYISTYIYHEIKSNVGKDATHTHTWILWVMVWFRAGISTNWERCMEIYHACICFFNNAAGPFA